MQEIIIEDGKRYLLLDEKGIPVIPVMKYLKYLDSTEKSKYSEDLLLCIKAIFSIFTRDKERLQEYTIGRLSGICWLVTESI